MISVIIPTRSRYHNLVNTLEALFNQSLDKSQYEVIVSDDNSTDETQSVINRFKDRGRFKYVFNTFKPHSWNASVPRNLGALVADPDTKAYLFVDSDVILPHHALEVYVEDLNKNSSRVIIGPYNFMDRNGVDVKIIDVRTPKFSSVSIDETFDTVHDGLACFGGNIVIPRDIFWSVNGFSVDTHIGLEDGDMGLKLWKKGTSFSYENRNMGTHQWHESPPDRFPNNMKEHIDNLNLKHYGTKDPDYGIIEASRETYASWGITGWNPPQEWLKMGFGLQINTINTDK